MKSFVQVSKTCSILAIGLFLLGCEYVTGRHLSTNRYELKVYVDTPNGLRTGSSIIEVSRGVGGKIWGNQVSGSLEINGQAATVSMPNGDTLFVLLRSKSNPVYAGVVGYPPDGSATNGSDHVSEFEIPRWKRLSYDPTESISNYPLMARFSNRMNPSTIEEVDPDNLEDAFGKGVKLRKITDQSTSKRIS